MATVICFPVGSLGSARPLAAHMGCNPAVRRRLSSRLRGRHPNPLPPGGAQELARQARVSQLQCIRMSFDHPPHSLGARPQAPPEVLTMLRALVLPDAPHAHVVFNVLLDHGHVEKLALVSVLASHHTA